VEQGRRNLILGIVAALALVAIIWLGNGSPDDTNKQLQAQKFTGSIPLNVADLQAKAAPLLELIANGEALDKKTWQPNLGYSALALNVTGSDKLAQILPGLYDQDLTAVTLTAQFGSGNAEPIVELAGSVAGGFKAKNSFDGLLTGFAPMNDRSEQEVMLGLSFQVRGGETQTVPAIATLKVSALAPKMEARFKSADGTIQAAVQVELITRGARVANRLSGGDLDYDIAMSAETNDGETVGRAMAKQGNALAAFWTAKAGGLGDSCAALRESLRRDVGLSAGDTVAVLSAFTARHALYAENPDYEIACLDGETARALEAMDMEMPRRNGKATIPAGLNTILGQMGRLMRDSNPDKARLKLEGYFADSVLIRDPHGVLHGLAGDVVFSGEGVGVLPVATPETGAEYLLSLPVARFACFSSGSGLRGAHRAGLLQFAGSSSIWVLDIAFRQDKRVAGVSVKQAGKREICQAIASRTTPESQCYFSQNGPYKPSDCR
jgi:hypothetical protein